MCYLSLRVFRVLASNGSEPDRVPLGVLIAWPVAYTFLFAVVSLSVVTKYLEET